MKDFGSILDEWDKITGKPYGKKQIKKDEHSNKKTQGVKAKEDNSKKINPMEMWLRRYGVHDKDAQEAMHNIDYAKQRKMLREMRCEDEIDLHGMTCDEAEAALNVFFENSIRRGLKKILIIHGKGNHSGGGAVLAPFVRIYLEKHKRAGECGHPKNADGGTGSTWVILK
ncbi:Smr/MutS family protein [Treponema sp. OMZ 788]|uniref:Smr/MutS family protein n=1 Tax=unclassified Treponema TaxID=2638727 RepID=UPI0020A5A064|nr:MULTISPECIES: Smr/MutS family protein [unclassified Treponema]UTC63429.1 Smr/MutS family protein [Treponema sp. OMZ 787]UTC63773.1 Smr/MutS family protein [Treponema sp. OMZ 788]